MQTYTPEQIARIQDQLNKEAVVHIRKRPGMYVGGTDSHAVHHVAYLAIDDVLAETMYGTCTEVSLTLSDKNTLCIQDNGVGLDITVNPETGLSGVERLMTKMGAGRKDYLMAEGQADVSSIIRTPGIIVVNALSEYMEIQTKRDGFLWQQRYAKGNPQTALECIRPLTSGESTGTAITFTPDIDIIEASFDYDVLARRCRDIAYVLRGLRSTIRDERGELREDIFIASDGVACWTHEQVRGVRQLHPIVHSDKEITLELSNYPKPLTMRVELAFQFTTGLEAIEKSYCNTVPTPEHGKHLEGLRAGILVFINYDAEKYSHLKFDWNDISPGFTGVVSLFHPKPHYATRLTVEIANPEVFDVVKKMTIDALSQQFPFGYDFSAPIIDHHLRRMRSAS